MLIGYARVSTADQNPDHQIDALTRAGVDPADIYLDQAGGAKASRPSSTKHSPPPTVAGINSSSPASTGCWACTGARSQRVCITEVGVGR